MAEQSIRDRIPANLPNDANFDAAWLRLRQELEIRLAARFGAATGDQDDEADPDILADLALERALMS